MGGHEGFVKPVKPSLKENKYRLQRVSINSARPAQLAATDKYRYGLSRAFIDYVPVFSSP
jgi:hypothetical protein